MILYIFFDQAPLGSQRTLSRGYQHFSIYACCPCYAGLSHNSLSVSELDAPVSAHAKHFVELREGFGHAFFVIDGDRAVSSELGDLQGHDHTVIVMRSV